MAFNLSKFSDGEQVAIDVQNGLVDIGQSYKADSGEAAINIDNVKNLGPGQQEVLDEKKISVLAGQIQKLLQMPQWRELSEVIKADDAVGELLRNNNPTVLKNKIEDLNLGGLAAQLELPGEQNRLITDYALSNYFQRIMTTYQQMQRVNSDDATSGVPGMVGWGFNLKRHKTAQVVAPDVIDEQSKGAFIQRYLDPIINYRGDKKRMDAISEQMKREITGTVSPLLENEVVDALESIQAMDFSDKERASDVLGLVYDKLVSPKGFEALQMGQTIMSNNPKGIIKFNLTDHILNSELTGLPERIASDLTKTASAFQSQEYVLYGPTEKRICPKLRGKRSEGGDVVSEYICRHHCLDGIAIDDNKTICGEALWRANVMDKYSRPYVNEDGVVEGGYLEKRFETNRNQPEETRMRLNPGETRKPRPPHIYGNLEARMQDMRNKEGEKRGYKPDTNTGEVFKWCTDVDQNNMGVSQSEKDRREKAMGHQTVQYSEKPSTENNPKVASKGFNLQKFAKRDQIAKEIKETHNDKDPDQLAIEIQKTHKDCKVDNDSIKKIEVKDFSIATPKKGFNLKQHKFATIPDDGYADGGSPYSDEEMKVIDKQYTCSKCNSTQRKGTPCKCSYGDGGPSNDRTPKSAQTIPLPEDGKRQEPEEPGDIKGKKVRKDDHHSRKFFWEKKDKEAAQYVDQRQPSPGSHEAWDEQAIINLMNNKTKCEKCGHHPCRCNRGDIGDPYAKKDKKSFNLKSHKKSMSSADIKDRGFQDAYAEALSVPEPKKKI